MIKNREMIKIWLKISPENVPATIETRSRSRKSILSEKAAIDRAHRWLAIPGFLCFLNLNDVSLLSHNRSLSSSHCICQQFRNEVGRLVNMVIYYSFNYVFCEANAGVDLHREVRGSKMNCYAVWLWLSLAMSCNMNCELQRLLKQWYCQGAAAKPKDPQFGSWNGLDGRKNNPALSHDLRELCRFGPCERGSVRESGLFLFYL